MNKVTKSFFIAGATVAALALLISCEYNNGKTAEQEHERVSHKHTLRQKHVTRQEHLENQKHAEMEHQVMVQRAHEKER